MSRNVSQFRPSRRTMLIAAALGAGAVLARGASQGLLAAGLKSAERRGLAFGTTVSLRAVHANEQRLNTALDAAWRELAVVEEAASLFRPQSALSRLNRDGLLDAPPVALVEMLTKAIEIASLTDGAFDPTVQPLWRVYQAAHVAGRQATAAEIAAASELIGWRDIELSPSRIRVRPGMGLTLNGVAQGYATDRCLDVLLQHGLEHAFLDTGELGAIGERPDGAPWTAAIADPRKPGDVLGGARPLNGFLATSGDYATTWSADFSHHHILDPRTQRSPIETASVTVLAPSGALADGLATAMMVLGPEKSLTLAESLDGVEALIITKSGALHTTASFPSRPLNETTL